MTKKQISCLAVCLALCLVLTGCTGLNFSGYFQRLEDLLYGEPVSEFDLMTYTRPDMERFAQTMEQCCTQASVETDLANMVQIIYDFYGVYDQFYTNFALAMIRYSQDQTDTYYQVEYQFCTEQSSQVDAGLDRFYRVLAGSVLREELESDAYFGADFFDRYEGESIYDDYFTTLLDQETKLENQYYDLMAQAGGDFGYTQGFYDDYGREMAEIYVELIRVRQAQATYAGYDSYPEFAYEFYYLRDYSVEQATSYLADVRAELVPLYRKITQDMDVVLYWSTEQEVFDYVQGMAQNMGSPIAEAFSYMSAMGLYDITSSVNKLDASFEIYIRGYHSPFVFVNPTGTEYDKLTFAHEFGHFCSDYVTMGSGASVDVAEIFSQSMEYLSLAYADADPNLAKLKMVDSLCIFVEQAAYASFEQQVYLLEGDALTVENVETLYLQTCENYGLPGDFSYVLITHFFTEPLYVISYVVSNDAAMQIYQMEQESAGAGLDRLQTSLEIQQPYFLAFLQAAGLESPFAAGRIQSVKETLQGVLWG